MKGIIKVDIKNTSLIKGQIVRVNHIEGNFDCYYVTPLNKWCWPTEMVPTDKVSLIL